MGYLSAYSTIEYLEGDLNKAISLHFQSNCYPPIPQELVTVAVLAVDALVDEDPERPISLPEGVTYREKDTVPAYEIADAFHLEAFVDYIITLKEQENSDD